MPSNTDLTTTDGRNGDGREPYTREGVEEEEGGEEVGEGGGEGFMLEQEEGEAGVGGEEMETAGRAEMGGRGTFPPRAAPSFARASRRPIRLAVRSTSVTCQRVPAGKCLS